MLVTAAESDRDRRGQVGVGTLIIFVAMVLVAALAAGVLFQAADELRSQAEVTGEESTAQVANDLTVYSTVGTVDGTGENIDRIEMTVGMVSGSNPIDVGGSLVDYRTSNGQTYLEVEDVKNGDAVLESDDDRRTVVIEVDDLEAGAEATVTLITSDNTRMTTDLEVPYELEAGESVPL
ncbi:archaellin/type IV pilin N-terminal domain-containing protein [Natronobacterium gregoryi]|uniref:Flagellin n=2 Tax=Natronobacterium gregoryi TaxID=44930 RepID=L0AI70_NATGS|nr:archaellin/type IV pilin N-terminal domain-containing protein [Natronobacterium gregoryi]AFZ73119.1 archaeal flagellin-like protein [Natronobacterium gregoryi SP2]ELY70782.1 flagellin A2 [Natronobacterium gregoryi SP2]PLK21533.1 flagellin A2 [Natronobacterium gregoryi SP2]SFI60802.1 flagellin FlaB [Natronobacterium gregoryi]